MTNATPGQRVEAVSEAIALLKRARDLCAGVGAKQAAAAVRIALHSVEGARRHAERLQPASERAPRRKYEKRTAHAPSEPVEAAAGIEPTP